MPVPQRRLRADHLPTTHAPMTEERPSKSERKREMHAVQAIGEALVALQDDEIARMDLPENLREAVAEAKRIRGFEAKRRQMQYIGKLMRHIDVEPVRRHIDSLKAASAEDVAQLHRIERWRDRLIADPADAAAFGQEYPTANVERLRKLAEDVAVERSRNAPPRAFRALFQTIRQSVDAAAAAVNGTDD